MDWSGTGILLSCRPHGEHAGILDVFTADHGRHAGAMRGAQSRRNTPMLQPGNQLALSWRARLADQLGTFTAEMERDRAALLMADRMRLVGLGATTGLMLYALPDRLPLPGFYDLTVQLLDVMAVTPAWPLMYLRWELALLDTMGFGLSLERCAVTGTVWDLAYVSPKTGRAVSREAAGDWADRLLPLPPCLRGEGKAKNLEISKALGTTGYFLRKHLTPQWSGQPFPGARERLIDTLSRTLD